MPKQYYHLPKSDLIKEYLTKNKKLKNGKIFTKKDFLEEFMSAYPDFKKKGIEDSLVKLSANDKNKTHYRRTDADDFLWKIDSHTFRLYDPRTDNYNENIEKNNIETVKSKQSKPKAKLIKKPKQPDTSTDKQLIINKAFKIILPTLANFIGNTLVKKNEKDWWKKYVLDKLNDNAKRDLPQKGDYDILIKKIDISACLNIIIKNWDYIFCDVMNKKQRDCTHGLLTSRNEEAHISTEKLETLSNEEIEHTLILIITLMRPINSNIADKISEMKKELNSSQ